MKHWIHLGTQKAGSTFLFGMLSQVPQIAVTARQELNFFGFAEDQSYDAYLSCFRERRPVLFENSPIYFREGARCAAPMASTMAERQTVLSLLLRDPIEAIISHHQMRLRQGFFRGPHAYRGDVTDLAGFIAANPAYVDDWRYMELLQTHWLPRFPSDRFVIGTFEEFTSDPLALLRTVAPRLGMENLDGVNPERAWRNPRPKSALANWLVIATGRNPALRAVRRKLMAVPRLRALAEKGLFARPDRRAVPRDEFAEARGALVEMLRLDVSRLAEFLGRRSPPWPNFYQVP